MSDTTTPRVRLSPRVRLVLQRAGMLIGAGLLAYQMVMAIVRIDWRAAALPGLPQAIAATALVFTALLIQMLAWRWTMRDLGTHLSLRMVVRGYFVSFLPRYIPGSAWGYLSRGAWFDKQAGVRLGVTSASSLLETATFLLSGLAYLLWSRLDSSLGAVIGALLTLAGYTTLRYVIARVARFGIPKRGSSPAGILACLAICAVWPFYGTALRMLIDVAAIDAASVVRLSAGFYVAWAGGMVTPFVPAGLGVREMIMSSALATDPALSGQATLLPLLLRLCTLGAELAWVGAGTALNVRENAKTDRTTQAGDSPKPHF